MSKVKISPEALMQVIRERAQDPEFIYKTHMDQLRAARKMYKDDAAIQAKLDTIEANIKAKYKAAMAVA